MSKLMPNLDEHGREILDQTPIAFPVGFARQEPLHMRIRRMVEQYHAEMRDAADYETFEDADDFDVDDGVPSYEDAPSAYEADFMPRQLLASKREQGTPAPAQEDPPKADPATETPKE